MTSEEILNELLEGNQRFIEGRNTLRTYSVSHLEMLAQSQTPKAAIIACSDSRVVPEKIFDQPLGSLFVSRVPANVASDGTKWMIDIAVGDMNVPLILVLAHSGCLAVKQIVDGKDGPGGSLRYKVQSALHEASSKGQDDLYNRTIDENARKTVSDLIAESSMVRNAVRENGLTIRAARYDMPTGRVVML